MKIPSSKRLGLGHLLKDHINSLVEIDSNNHSRRNKSDFAIFFLTPTLVGIATFELHGHIRAPSQMIAGVVIITGLLFGLLAHVLSLGIHVANDDRYGIEDRIVILLDELRANISWAIAVGLLLNSILVLVGTFNGDEIEITDKGYSSWLSGIIISLFVHLMLTLFMILIVFEVLINYWENNIFINFMHKYLCSIATIKEIFRFS